MEKVVVIGGGTGSYTVLRGLKKYDIELTAVVSMMDSGGSTGRLRDEFGFLPPGDARRCLIALSPDTGMLRNLFEYRFNKGTGLNGHNLGNLLLTALRDITGAEEAAIQEAAKILNVKGKILPVTTKNCHLGAVLENEQVVVSETNIDIPRHDAGLRIKELFLAPRPPKAYEGAVKSILEADKIVIGPGDLYTSIIPNLLISGIPEAIKESKAKKIYVCNIMTKHGETTGFKASDFVKELEKYLGKGVLDYVVCNNKKPAPDLMKEYKKEKAEFVEPDLKSNGYKIVKADLLDKIDLARHNPDKLAKTIMNI
ncbi:YvcK family protein [Candidatus Woesearchaeota archaeon]|nr:YvcK family protein [Candidatus Woesearchaeota archaeon]